MAIIRSMGVGRARKSMGNVTYRTVRGRTIGSQKRGASDPSATTRGFAGNFRKPLFAMINMFMREHSTDINVSFDRSKYGSQRNYFFTTNYTALSRALNGLAQSASTDGALPTMSEVEEAITAYATINPTAIQRVKLAGFRTVYLTGAWSSSDNPESGGSQDALGTGDASFQEVGGEDAVYLAPIALSTIYYSGAKIVRPAGVVTLTAKAIPAGITKDDIFMINSDGDVDPSFSATEVTSSAGTLSYNSTALSAADNIVCVQIGTNIFVRITSAYVKVESEDPSV